MKYASIPTSQLAAWASLNNVELRGIKIEADILDTAGNSKGGGIVSTAEHSEAEPLLIVPHDIILTEASIRNNTRSDSKLRELFDVLDGTRLTQTTRGLFVVFLLYQFTIASPDLDMHGVQNSFTDYAKFLPKDIPLPTFYSAEEIQTLQGTSLSGALTQKLASLQKDFEMLRQRTKGLGWARKNWWGLETYEGDEDSEEECSGPLRFDDWKLMDAIYRSRALELPNNKGIVMVPVLDMTNHASDGLYNARFESDGDGNVMLVTRDVKNIQPGEEITIMYGCGGACEMIFSYGFLDPNASSAREVFLDLSIPLDDPLRLVKMRFAETAPGVRLYLDQTGKVGWDSDFVWWACINEEDGLDFQVLQTNDGQKEMKAIWKDHGFQPNQLKDLLMKDHLRDIFVLRSLVLLQQRVEEQGVRLSESEEMLEQARDSTAVRHTTWELISKLRVLELELLTAAYQKLEDEKAAMLDSEAVRRYFGTGNGPSSRAGEEDQEQEDFS